MDKLEVLWELLVAGVAGKPSGRLGMVGMELEH